MDSGFEVLPTPGAAAKPKPVKNSIQTKKASFLELNSNHVKEIVKKIALLGHGVATDQLLHGHAELFAVEPARVVCVHSLHFSCQEGRCLEGDPIPRYRYSC